MTQKIMLKLIKNQIFVLFITIFCHLSTCTQHQPSSSSTTSTPANKTETIKQTIKWDSSKVKVWGPGLNPSKIILPARYFFIHDKNRPFNENELPPSHPLYDIKIIGSSKYGPCRYSTNQLYRADGSTIVRYKMIDTCRNAEIHIRSIQNDMKHVGQSPYRIHDDIYAETCNCPKEIDQWMIDNECRQFEKQIHDDLKPFQTVNFTQIREKILEKFTKMPGSVSLCHYILLNNEIYRQCYGQHTGFKMFMDSVLISILRKVQMPDMEFFVNLGDWPLMKKGGQSRTTGPYPIFSWCGSDDTFDIVMPTYDITESTLENMGRVTLDMLSVQHVTKSWNSKIDRAFWRGRDSRRERLQLIDIARGEHADLFNVSLTNFFFFRDEELKYGPKVAHISFMEFFEYKYQICIDGTVAAYRFPYLLGGDSIVLKQESPFYEHFYKRLQPFHHYIPFKRDLSDLVEKIQYAQAHESDLLEIIANAQKFVNENLLPKDIYCYHVLLFKNWSENLVSNIRIQPDMERVSMPPSSCDCTTESKLPVKDEL